MRKRPIYPIHPGEILAGELAELGKTPTYLARELYVPANRISQLVAGKRAMTADTALRLEKWLGVSAACWMNLQTRYELDMARAHAADSIKSIKPIRQRNSIGQTVAAIRKGVADVEAGRTKPARATLRRLGKKYGFPLTD